METLATTLTASEKEAAIAGGIAGATIAAIFMIALTLYIITVIATWKIFKKAGEPGWKCLIPIYNVYIMYKIVGIKHWFWIMLGSSIALSIVTTIDGTSAILYGTEEEIAKINLAAHPATIIALIVESIVAIWGSIVYAWRTSKAFGHDVGYFIGLLFLQPIFWLILGFGNSKYDKKILKKSSTKTHDETHHESHHESHKETHHEAQHKAHRKSNHKKD